MAYEEIRRRREEIDRIDDIVMTLLAQRLDLALKIGALKGAYDLPILHNGREHEILEKTGRYKYGEFVRNIYRTIVEESRKLQENT